MPAALLISPPQPNHPKSSKLARSLSGRGVKVRFRRVLYVGTGAFSGVTGAWLLAGPRHWLEARARLGCQTAGELGAPAISSIPEQLPGHEPASARKGYEGERTLHSEDIDVHAPGLTG